LEFIVISICYSGLLAIMQLCLLIHDMVIMIANVISKV